MTSRIGSKGQVVIPKELRERRGLAPGAAVEVEDHREGVLVRPAQRPHGLKGRFARTGMAGRLLEDRAREPR